MRKKIHYVENLRSIHFMTRRQSTLKLEFTNFRLFYMRHLRATGRAVNEREAKEKNPAYRRFRELGESRRIQEAREFLKSGL